MANSSMAASAQPVTPAQERRLRRTNIFLSLLHFAQGIVILLLGSGFSASVMIVVIASLCGMTEMVSLIALFGLTGAMNLFGLMMELHNQNTAKTNWTSFIFGSVGGNIPWIGIVLYFASATPAPPM